MRLAIWTGGGVLALAGLLLFGFNTNNPNTLRWAALGGLFLCLTIYWAWAGCKLPRDPITWAASAFVAYAGLSILWSPDSREGVVEFVPMVTLWALFVALRHGNRRALALLLPIVAVCAYWMQVWIHWMRPHTWGGLGNENFQAEFLVLIVPFILIHAFRYPNSLFGVICMGSALAALIQAFFVNGSNAQFAGLAGLGAGVAGLLLARKRYRLAGGLGLVGGLAVYGIATQTQVLKSLLYRLEIAHNTALMWLDRPWFGVGHGAFNYEYPRYAEAHMEWMGRDCELTQTCSAVHGVQHFIGAAHNEYMQALATLGIVGLALAFLVIGLALKRAWDYPCKERALQGMMLAVLAMLVGLCLVNFPLQNPATAVLAVTALALCAKRAPGGRGVGWAKWPLRALPVALAVFLAMFHWAAYVGEVHFTQAKRWARIGSAVQSLYAANEAFKAFPWRSQYRMQISLSLESARANDSRVRVQPEVADKAHRISMSASPHHQGVLFARGAYLLNTGRWKENRREIARIVKALETYGATHTESWQVIASYRGLTGDRAGAVAAISKALRLGARFDDVQKTAAGFGLRISKNGEQDGG